MKKLEIKYIHKDKLCLLEGNPRKIIDPKSSDKLKTLIKEHGFQNPLQVFKEKTNRYSILCGNHRYKAGCELGIKEFPCIVYEGSRNKALARAISDNKSNLWTDWDIPALKDFFAEIDIGDFDIELTGFTEDELKGMFDFGELDGNEDEVPEVNRKDGKTKLGDLYQLGEHRLLCGSAIIASDIKKVLGDKKANMVFTDPPYDFKNDFLSLCFDNVKNGHIFIMDGDKNHVRNISNFIDHFNVFYVLFFKAPTWNLSKKIPLTQHLLIAHYKKGKPENRELKMLHSVIETSTKNDRSVKEYVAKRQEAIIPFIEGFSDKGDVVLDIFGGTGSTLIACEKTQRLCKLVEIDPHCCDIIIKRWEDYTGKEAVLLN